MHRGALLDAGDRPGSGPRVDHRHRDRSDRQVSPVRTQPDRTAHGSAMVTNTCDIDLAGLSRQGSALSDGTRRRLLVALARGPGYPAELAVELGETGQNVSNHLACLCGCGLVIAAPEGRRLRDELDLAGAGLAARPGTPRGLHGGLGPAGGPMDRRVFRRPRAVRRLRGPQPTRRPPTPCWQRGRDRVGCHVRGGPTPLPPSTLPGSPASKPFGPGAPTASPIPAAPDGRGSATRSGRAGRRNTVLPTGCGGTPDPRRPDHHEGAA